MTRNRQQQRFHNKCFGHFHVIFNSEVDPNKYENEMNVCFIVLSSGVAMIFAVGGGGGGAPGGPWDFVGGTKILS